MTSEEIKVALLRARYEIDRMESYHKEVENLRQVERETMVRELINCYK